MNILGLGDVTGNHSHSSIAIVRDGSLLFALSRERQSRLRNDSQFPAESIQAGLNYLGLSLSDIDAVVCAYPPPRYYAGLLFHGWGDAVRSMGTLLLRAPHQLLRYLLPNLKKALFDPRGNHVLRMGIPPSKFQFVDHHLAHVTAAYCASPYDRALAISYGGFAPHADGTNRAGAVYLCEGNSIQWQQDIPMCATGCWFSGVTVALGYRYMQQESKTMGLAGLGKPDAAYKACSGLATRYENGRWQRYPYWLDTLLSPRSAAFLNTRTGRRLKRLLRSAAPQDLAAAAQQIWQENITAFVRNLLQQHKVRNLVLSGGTFQNIQINSELAQLPDIDGVYLHPHPGDGSTPIGAALHLWQQHAGKLPRHSLPDAGLGCEFSDAAVKDALARYKDRVLIKNIENASIYGAGLLSQNRIIGWFQGREEYGNRSLGHRCILAFPAGEHRLSINRIKGREDWIPVGVSCLAEHAASLFESFMPSPYASFRFRFNPRYQDTHKFLLHCDGTIRVQSVDEHAYPEFRSLLQVFYERTGQALIFNSSLNRHAEPIVHTPAQAIDLLLNTSLDALIIGSFCVTARRDNV
ncbi:MAG: carbamoyltransferase C-terminal domain-containing protein [candidate division KSB1 bacterium]|nr:carbamoyltransferase C-terminal domain-containing protein [candidate division KSB1 bacterium]